MSVPTDGGDDAAAVWRRVRPELLDLAEALCARLGVLDDDPDDHAAWQEARSFTHRLAGPLRLLGPPAAADAAVSLEGLIGDVDRVDLDLLSRARALAEAVRLALVEPS